MFKLTHTDLIQVGELLGYKFSDSGLCNGFTCMLAQAVLSADESNFWARMNLLAKYKGDFNSLINEIEAIKQKNINAKKLKEKNQEPLSEKEINLLEILSFYDGIELYLETEIHSDVFNKFVFQQNFKEIYRLAKSIALKESDISIVLDKNYAFNKNSLTNYINDLAEILNNHLDIPIMLGSGNHSVFLKYNAKNSDNPWMYTDTNDFERFPESLDYYRELNNEELVDNLFISLSSAYSTHVVFNTTLLADSGHPINNDDSLKNFDLNYTINSENVRMYDLYDVGLLYLSCQNGHVEEVNRILAHECIEINKANYKGVTPLYIACQNGHVEVVAKFLVKENIEINKVTHHGATALFIACQNGHVEVVTQLLQQKEIEINKAKHNGVTPLYIACQEGHIEVVDLLLQSNKAEVNSVGLQNHTPLLVACLSPHTQGKDRLFRLLLTNNADLQHTNDSGQTALDIAFLQHNNSAIKEIFLYAEKSDLSLDLLMSPETKKEALRWAHELPADGFFDNHELTLKKFIQQNTSYDLKNSTSYPGA